ncbi:hypothetical protein PTTG_08490 [Puccinia triticina 1-1 BBBD Race 1]|uniref:CFEM domain-containing protein n=1 Tax=Puccinia triticina (isolate 1-1 / race 1 (BBBD)) TaxID=630390 RepID=A0A180GRW5_PUCT1|nr:hypothetical protein PTTG_08490 [Puccinia triticina 1-1 BBBD Race 1]
MGASLLGEVLRYRALRVAGCAHPAADSPARSGHLHTPEHPTKTNSPPPTPNPPPPSTTMLTIQAITAHAILALACLALACLAPAASAQDTSGLPACAQNCLAASLRSSARSCAPVRTPLSLSLSLSSHIHTHSPESRRLQTDFACLCRNSEFVAASDSCYSTSCSAGELAAAQEWGVKSCAAAGIQITLNGANNTSTGTNTVPLNNTSTPARPNAAPALSAEAGKLLAMGTACLSSFLIVA